MALTIGVGLYTSRLVLQALGIEDYGIYGVISSLIALSAFANTSLEGASTRYLTYELGKGNIEVQRSTFASSLRLHISVAIVTIVLAETVGLWMMCNKLDIPHEKSEIAITTYHLIAVTTAIGFLQTPFNASIIAHERFGIYTIIETVNVTIKLSIAFILLNSNSDRLILYSALLLTATIIVTLIYVIYCKHKFAECRLSHKPDKATIKALTKFASWDLYGNMCVSAREQGSNILINTFFGVILNAAVSIATLVNTYFTMMIYNVIRAFNPQITKQYAQGNINTVQELLTNCTKTVVLLTGMIAIPLYAECDKILSMWLVTVPEYSVTFTRLLIITTSIGLIINTTNCLIHATGKIKAVSFITGTIYLASIPITYLLLKKGYPPEIAYIVMLSTTIMGLISNVAIMKHLVAEISLSSILRQILPTLTIALIAIGIALVLHNTMHESIIRLITISTVNVLFLGLCTYKFVLSKQDKIAITAKITNKEPR